MQPQLRTVAWLMALCVTAGTAQVKHLKLEKDQSSMTYRLVHPLHHIEATSHDVNYELEADTSSREIKRVSGSVDVTTFDSGNSNRDSHAMEVIDAIDFPEARFEGTGFQQRGDSLFITGKITFHGITRDVAAGATTRWSNGTLEVRGSFDLSLEEFKIDRPTLLMIPVGDRLSFSFVAVFAIQG